MGKVSCLLALYNICSTANLFKYMKERYSQSQVQALNRVLRQKSKYVRACAREHAGFLDKCLELWITPKHIQTRVSRSKANNPSSIERAFMRDEIAERKDLAANSRNEYTRNWQFATKDLSFLDLLRFSKLITVTVDRLEEQIRKKNEKTIKYLLKDQHGTQTLKTSSLVNLSKETLTDTEEAVLCRGLNFGIPPACKPEEIFAEFELCWGQLEKETPVSTEKLKECKATMAGMAQKYTNMKIDRTGFSLEQRHLKAINNLKKKKNIIITRPDKGNGCGYLGPERLHWEDESNSIGQKEIRNESAKQRNMTGPYWKNEHCKTFYWKPRKIRTCQTRFTMKSDLWEQQDRGCMVSQNCTRMGYHCVQSCRWSIRLTIRWQNGSPRCSNR